MPEGMCKADGCDKPIGKAGGRGMCQKHLKRWRELRGALGLPLPPREAPRRSRASAPKRPGACLVADCHKPEGKFGGEGRCKTHLAEYREERRRAGKPLPLSNASKVLRDEPGYEIEDWPEDQHYGLSVDGICSAPWGCGQPVGRKGARGLCSKHVKRWADAYRARGLTPPKRSSGRDPRCRLPDDDTLVQLVRDHGSYNKVAEACDVTRSTLQDFLDRRPALKARMDAEWRLIYKPRTYKTEEQRRAREQERGRQARRRRGLVSAERVWPSAPPHPRTPSMPGRTPTSSTAIRAPTAAARPEPSTTSFRSPRRGT